MDGTLQHLFDENGRTRRRDHPQKRSTGVRREGRSCTGSRARRCVSMDRSYDERAELRRRMLHRAARFVARAFARMDDESRHFGVCRRSVSRPPYTRRQTASVLQRATSRQRVLGTALLRTDRYESGALVRGAIGRSGHGGRCRGLLRFLGFAVASLLTFSHVGTPHCKYSYTRLCCVPRAS